MDVDKIKKVLSGLDSLKRKVDKLDVIKLKLVPLDLKKLSDVVDNNVVKNTLFSDLTK